MCWLSTGDEFHAQWESIKMSGCKNPRRALAETEYENRYRKNSKLCKFWGNTSLCFSSSFFSWDNPMLGYCYQKRAMIFLIRSSSCGFGTLLCRAAVAMLHGLGCDFPQSLLQLEAPFAGRGSWAGGQGSWHGVGSSTVHAGGVGLIDTCCHLQSYLCL